MMCHYIDAQTDVIVSDNLSFWASFRPEKWQEKEHRYTTENLHIVWEFFSLNITMICTLIYKLENQSLYSSLDLHF